MGVHRDNDSIRRRCRIRRGGSDAAVRSRYVSESASIKNKSALISCDSVLMGTEASKILVASILLHRLPGPLNPPPR
eukprot:7784378-Alexandrium_andersonii.AAC.1